MLLTWAVPADTSAVEFCEFVTKSTFKHMLSKYPSFFAANTSMMPADASKPNGDTYVILPAALLALHFASSRRGLPTSAALEAGAPVVAAPVVVAPELELEL